MTRPHPTPRALRALPLLLMCSLVAAQAPAGTNATATATAATTPANDTPDTAPAPGLPAIAALARLNGTALACQDLAAARRAKQLMLAHAPKTARYGQAFEDGTQAAFLATTRAAPGAAAAGTAACPDTAEFMRRLDSVARDLQAVLPATGAR